MPLQSDQWYLWTLHLPHYPPPHLTIYNNKHQYEVEYLQVSESMIETDYFSDDNKQALSSSTTPFAFASTSGYGYTAAFIVPTGVGASIGGYAGDAMPVRKKKRS